MKFYYLGIDIGGSHLSGAAINSETGLLVDGSYQKIQIDSKGSCEEFLTCFESLVEKILNSTNEVNVDTLAGIGIAMPGPFDYKNGISHINGVQKFDSIFGLNVKREIEKMVNNVPVYFINDASSFATGEYASGAAVNSTKSIVLTLGTGFGSTFLIDGIMQDDVKYGVPDGGYLYHIPFKEGIADDYFSTRWFVNKWNNLDKESVTSVEAISKFAAEGDSDALDLFDEFADNFIEFMTPWVQSFKPDAIVLGGGIAKAAPYFMDKLQAKLNANNTINIKICQLWDMAAIFGAASYAKTSLHNEAQQQETEWRKTQQFLAPVKKDVNQKHNYDAFPAFALGNGKINAGAANLAAWMQNHKTIVIDGYQGVFWHNVVQSFDAEFEKKGVKVRWYHVDAALKSPDEIEKMVQPYLGGDDPVFGKITDKDLIDWFDAGKLKNLKPDDSADINILIGYGAALAGWDAPLVYFDLPKNELQFRARAGKVSNLGTEVFIDNRQTYKRFFFIDWVVLNKHKNSVLPSIDIIVDEQRPDEYLFMTGDDLRDGLTKMATNVFRPRPWFEPGAWGGSWMKEHMDGLNNEVDNLAWSFELMVLENGLLFESDRYLLEVSFDFIMFNNYKEVLGVDAETFKYDFPIRFDFLDTFDGGNLSIQCHPSPAYIKEHFGMPFTQDETYYILDTKEEPVVYLGFQESVQRNDFHAALQHSHDATEVLEVEKYVQKFTAKKHDLFLIPHGTIHASGSNNLVLEISSAPYIFTFKMYDWLRLDLDGKPRPINIERGMANVNFDRNGDSVVPELISKPYILTQNNDYIFEHLPTHADHFYDVHRYNLTTKIDIETKNKCHVWMVVEGQSIVLETENGVKQRFNYAETFVVPAAAKRYTIYNENPDANVMLVKAFIK